MKRRVGRVNITFEKLQEVAAEFIAEGPLGPGDDWRLTGHSSLHRRRDGTFTLLLVWRSGDGRTTSTRTIRGLR